MRMNVINYVQIHLSNMLLGHILTCFRCVILTSYSSECSGFSLSIHLNMKLKLHTINVRNNIVYDKGAQ